MAFDYSGLAATALAQINDKGTICYVRYETDAEYDIDADTIGTSIETDVQSKFVRLEFKRHEIDGTIVQSGDFIAMLAASDLQTEPKNDDFFIEGDLKYKIQKVNIVKPADKAVIYKLHVRFAGVIELKIPSNVVLPSIEEVGSAGELKANIGTWSAFPFAQYLYQWKRNGVNIENAVNSRYFLTDDDLLNLISVEVTALNSEGQTSEESLKRFVMQDKTTFFDISVYNIKSWFAAWKEETITVSDNLTNKISEWSDYLGGEISAVQTSFSTQPTTETQHFNGLNLIRFDGSARMNVPNSIMQAGAMTAFFVHVPDSASQNYWLLSSFGGANHFKNQALQIGDTNISRVGGSVEEPIIQMAGVTEHSSEAEIFLQINADDIITEPSDFSDGNPSSIKLGSWGGGAFNYRGGIGDVIMVHENMPIEQKTMIRQFLSKLWGVSIT